MPIDFHLDTGFRLRELPQVTKISTPYYGTAGAEHAIVIDTKLVL